MWFRRWLDRLDDKRLARKYERDVCKPLSSEQVKGLQDWLKTRRK